MIRPTRRLSPPRAMRAVVWFVTLGAYSVAALGLLPSPRELARFTGWVAGERYPCEDCACGCASAMECWTSCCCHTPQERLAWAIRHHITPPVYVDFTACQWSAARKSIARASTECTCCSHSAEAGVADSHSPPAVVVTSSCANDVSGAAANPAADRATSDSGKPSVSALVCKGLSAMSAAGISTAPPSPIASLLFPEPTPLRYPNCPVNTPFSQKLDTPTPPPRSV